MANRYWVGNGGNWSDAATHWSDSAGGTPNASFLPTASDNVYFNGSSGTGAVTIDGTSGTPNVCFNLDASLSTILTFNGGSGYLDVYGDFTLKSGLSWTGGHYLTFKATTTVSITTAGTHIDARIRIDGVGGTFNLQNNTDFGYSYGSSSYVYLYNGTFKTNNYTFDAYQISTSGSAASAFNFGSSTVTVGTGSYSINNSNCVVTSTGTISSKWYFDLGSNASSSYYDLIWYVNEHSQGGVGLTGTKTIHNLTFQIYSSSYTYIRGSISGTFTVTGTVTFTGWDSAHRLTLEGGTINAAAVSGLQYVNFYAVNITGASAPWSGTRLGNVGGNTGITFDSPRTLYWVGDTGTWSTASHWSLSSNGSGGQDYPLPQDNAIFDRYSFSTTGKTVSSDVRVMAHNIDFSDCNEAFTFGITTYNNTYFTGSFTFSSYGTFSYGSNQWWYAIILTENVTMDFKGVTCNEGFSIYTYGYTVHFLSAYTGESLSLYAYYNTANNNEFDFGGNTITVGSLYFSNSQLTSGQTLTINHSGSSIDITGTAGYYTLSDGSATKYMTHDHTGSITFSGASGNKYISLPYYQNIQICPIIFSGAGQFTVTTTRSGHTIENLTATAGGQTVRQSSGAIVTYHNFNVRGTSGSFTTLKSTTTDSFTYFSKASSNVDGKYLTLQDTSVEGGANWYAGATSVDTIRPNAVTYYTETYVDTDNAMYSGNYIKYAQSFYTAASLGYLKQAKFYLKKVGSPTGTAVAKIYTRNGSSPYKPTGSALYTSETLDVSTLGTSYALATFTFSGYNSLPKYTYYVVSIEYSGGDSSNYIVVGTDNSSPTYSSGNFSSWFDGDADWTGTTAKDASFYIYESSNMYWLWATSPSFFDFYADGIVKATQTKTFTSDGHIVVRNTKEFTADGHIVFRIPNTFTVDGIVKVLSNTKTFTLDAVVKTINVEKTFIIEGGVIAAGFSTFDIDGVVLVHTVKTFTIDAHSSPVFFIGGYVAGQVYIDIDGIIFAKNERYIVLDGYVVGQMSQSFTIDGEVYYPRYSLGEVVLSRPKKIGREYIYLKTDYTSITGKLTRDTSYMKEKYYLSWELLTKVEADSILEIIERNCPVYFSVEESGFVVPRRLVIPYIASKEYSILGDEYRVSLVLELIEEEV